MALTSYGGGVLFGRRFGSNEPDVVALHGWGRRSDDFVRMLDGFDAIALDLPGFGATPPPDRVIGAAGYAELILPVLTDLARPSILIGHSFGGRVAVALAATHPEMVGGLVLTGVPLIRRAAARPSWSYRTIRAAHRLGLVSDDRMERIRRSRGSADYRAATGIMRDILVKVVNESYEPELTRLRVPVRMIWGADDLAAPVDVARRALSIMQDAGVDATLDVVDGVGHMLPVERPEPFRAVLESETWR